MKQRSRTQAELELVRNAEVVCTSAFRPGAVAQLIQKGQRLPRSSQIVKRNPSFFALEIPLVEYLETQTNSD